MSNSLEALRKKYSADRTTAPTPETMPAPGSRKREPGPDVFDDLVEAPISEFNDEGWRLYETPDGRDLLVINDDALRQLARKFVISSDRKLSEAEGGGHIVSDLTFRFGQNKDKGMASMAANATGRSYLRWVHSSDFHDAAKAFIRVLLGETADEVAERHRRTEDIG